MDDKKDIRGFSGLSGLISKVSSMDEFIRSKQKKEEQSSSSRQEIASFGTKRKATNSKKAERDSESPRYAIESKGVSSILDEYPAVSIKPGYRLMEVPYRNHCGGWDYTTKLIYATSIDDPVKLNPEQYVKKYGDIEARPYIKHLQFLNSSQGALEFILTIKKIDQYAMAFECPPYHHERLILSDHDLSTMIDSLEKEYKNDDTEIPDEVYTVTWHPLSISKGKDWRVSILVDKWDALEREAFIVNAAQGICGSCRSIIAKHISSNGLLF